ncbi:MAG: hypothetical protein ACO3EF_05645, partial [Vulcanococcus sp.]
MIELETMLMQFCLETSGRQNGDRYPVGKGEVSALVVRGPSRRGLRLVLPAARITCCQVAVSDGRWKWSD